MHFVPNVPPATVAINLATLAGIEQVLETLHPAQILSGESLGAWDGTYCSHCGDIRRTSLIIHWYGVRWHKRSGDDELWLDPPPAASLLSALCLQCQHQTDLIVHRGPNGWELVALPQTYGGLSTPDTPEGVAYYLDQAQRAQAVGARSAAIAMYRSALEHLLHEQGYTKGMLGQRIKQLEADPAAPKWRDQLDPDYLTVINALGNAAIHANDGDIAQQTAFEGELLVAVRELFIELLTRIYERPKQDAARMAGLKKVIGSIQR